MLCSELFPVNTIYARKFKIKNINNFKFTVTYIKNTKNVSISLKYMST